jgi:hypothetical protein
LQHAELRLERGDVATKRVERLLDAVAVVALAGGG